VIDAATVGRDERRTAQPPHEALLFFDDKVIDGVRSGSGITTATSDRY